MLRLATFALLFALTAAGPAAALESAPSTSSRDTFTFRVTSPAPTGRASIT